MPKKKKYKKHSKLTEKKKEEMFQAFLIKQSNRFVSKKCGVSETTVRRHREWDRWDERRDITLKAAEKKMIVSAAQAIINNLKIVRAVKGGVTKKLLEQLKEGTYDPTVHELAKLIETEGNLLVVSPEGLGGKESVVIYIPDNKRDKKGERRSSSEKGRR